MKNCFAINLRFAFLIGGPWLLHIKRALRVFISPTMNDCWLVPAGYRVPLYHWSMQRSLFYGEPLYGTGNRMEILSSVTKIGGTIVLMGDTICQLGI